MKLDLQKNIPWAFLTFLILVVLLNLTLFGPYLLALYFGWIISVVIGPFYHWLLKKKWKDTRAALVCTFTALFTMIIPIVGFGFATTHQLIKIIGPYTKDGVNVDEWLSKIYQLPLVDRVFDNQEELKTFAVDYSKKFGGKMSEMLSAILASTPGMALQIVLALLATYFILVDGKKLSAWMNPRIPLTDETKTKFAKNLNDTAYSSFLSMLAAALAQSIVVFIGFLVLGVPMAPLAFGIAFVCAWFPIFGVTPVWLGALIFLMATDHIGKGFGMLGFGIVASLIDNVVRPWVLKGRSDMHPLISLIAIFGGIAYLGIPGILVGPVVVSFGIEFLRQWPAVSKEIGLFPGKGDKAANEE